MNHTSKIVKFDLDAREEILNGVNILANAVKITMGPRGRNVVIENPGDHPVLTKDGVTVASAVNLKDSFQNLGVQMIKEAAARTADVAGDGTTAATVLTQAIFSEGLKMLAAGYQASEIKVGINLATSQVLKTLKKFSVPIATDEELLQIATISSNGESEVGALICDAIKSVGADGVVTVEEAKGLSSSLSVLEGMQINRGSISPYFITNHDKMITEFNNPYVLLCNKKITSMKEIVSILEQCVEGQSSLLIVSDDLDGDALQGLVVNHTRGALSACAIKSPGFGETRVHMLQDLSIVLDCPVISDASSETLESISINNLGRCKKAIVTKSSTIFIGGSGKKEKIKERCDALKSQLSDPSLDKDEISLLKMRLSRLSGGVAVLKVGGATEAELRERRDRVDDALNATQAAIEEGIVPGGGVALVRASKEALRGNSLVSNGTRAGMQIVYNACHSPLKQIVENAGGTPEIVLEKVISSKKNTGYNAALDAYGDMIMMGIIDPVKVVRSALENASSAASMMLTVGCAMIDDLD